MSQRFNHNGNNNKASTYSTSVLDTSYLTKQNRKLRMQLAETIQLKQLHQQVLIQINQQYPQSSVIKTLVEIINRTASQSRKNKQNQCIMQLQGKMMVLEKISQQTQLSEKETYNLLAEEFRKLKQQNTRISQQLHKFYQKIGQVDYISGLVTKYKQLITPTEQTMAFKKQQNQLLDALNIQQQTIKRITQQRDKLLKINVYMKEEVERKKDQVRNMTIMLINGCEEDEEEGNVVGNILDQLEQENINADNHNKLNTSQQQHFHNPMMSDRSSISTRRANLSKLNTSLSQNNPNTTLNFIKSTYFLISNYLVQRQLLKNVQQQSQSNSSFTNQSDCPQLTILFPDKVEKIKRLKEQAKVPYLNMKKVREMMAKREEKMRKQWQQEKIHINPTTKIIQLQTQLDITRKQLANQSLKFRLMEQQLKTLRVTLQEQQKRNQLFVESNHRLKSNYQVIFKDYQLCKAITMQVERALGMAVGRDNQHKVRERLSALLGNKLQQEQTNNENANTRQNKQQKSNNTPYQHREEQQQYQESRLEETFKEQLRTRRFMDIFGQQRIMGSSENVRRALSK